MSLQEEEHVTLEPSLEPFGEALMKSCLLIDATNTLSRSAADRDRWRHCGTSLNTEFERHLDCYTAAATNIAKLIAVFDSPSGISKRSSTLRTYKRRSRPSSGNIHGLAPFQAIVKKKGGLALVADDGYEADDVIAHAAVILSQLKYGRTIIASSDKDFLQVLDSNTDFMHTTPSTRSNPSGYEFLCPDWVHKTYGFQPSAMADYQALVGNSEKGIPGFGISSSTAKKLLQKHGSINSILLAAEEGTLKGWGGRVSSALPMKGDSLRNVLSVTRLENNTSMTPQQVHDLTMYIETGATLHSHALPEVTPPAWLHPAHNGRWQYVKPLVPGIVSYLMDRYTCSVQSVVETGYPVDIIALREGQGRGPLKLCIVVASLADFSSVKSAEAAEKAWIAESTSLQDLITLERTVPLSHWGLSNFTKRHISELKRALGKTACVLVIPYFWELTA